ncbi:MAG: LysR family transcriptional regulator [Microbispora sp.]|nr:LysR family transcriptional regulator [Microbispora sp.]
MQAAEGAVAGHSGMVRGTIRVGTTPSLARRVIIPALPRFTARYPGIDIDLHLSDAVIDLVQKGIDCVIRAGEPRPSSLIVRRITHFQWYVCGSPDYLKRHGEPACLADLQGHVAVGYSDSRTGRSTNWIFREGEEVTALSMKESVTVNDTDAYIAAGLAGLGLIRAASYLVHEYLSEGRLVRLFANLEASTAPLSVLYPQSRHLSPAVRTFIDWCIEIIGQEARNW